MKKTEELDQPKFKFSQKIPKTLEQVTRENQLTSESEEQKHLHTISKKSLKEKPKKGSVIPIPMSNLKVIPQITQISQKPISKIDLEKSETLSESPSSSPDPFSPDLSQRPQ